MGSIKTSIIIFAILLFSSFSAIAQENEPLVVDEVVAQVNEGVLTLSRIKREMNDAINAIVQQQGKARETAKAEVESKQGELIANLINEELLIQKAKEIGIDKDIEAEINARFLDKTRELNLKSIEKLYEEMRKAGINPEDVRENWRRDIVRGLVIRSEVGRKIYINLTGKEIKDYFAKNKAKFIEPETVSLSAIFLSLAAADPAVVRERAKGLVDQARKGADFVKLSIENSEREDAKQAKGFLGAYPVKDLPPSFANPLRGVKAGGITDPIELDEGIMILRVDKRTEEASEASFDEEKVRQAIVMEKMPEESKAFLIELRADAYIKISEAYRAVVSPVLFEDERKAEAAKKTAKN